MNSVRIVVVALFMGLFGSTVQGQGKAVSVSHLAVDVISLKSGKSVRGIVVSAHPDEPVNMVADRQWLQQHNPELSHQAIAEEAEQRQQAINQLIERLKKRLANPVTAPGLQFFLKQELERAVAQQKSPPDPPQFVWLEFNRDLVIRVITAPPDRQRVAIWAWSERLPNVEARDYVELQRELKQRKIDVTVHPPDLSDRLGPRVQDEREWFARLALVEYALGKPFDFQGTGDLLIRTDSSQKMIDLAPLLTRSLSSQVDSLLKELTGEPQAAPIATVSIDWLKSATTEADKESVRGLRATRVEVQTEGMRANVQTAFAARMPNGNWEIIWSHRESQDGTRPRAEMEAKIAADPQIKQITAGMKSLGVSADDQIRQAIRFGAATMAAQQSTESRFFEFRDRYTRHLDGPPLNWGR